MHSLAEAYRPPLMDINSFFIPKMQSRDYSIITKVGGLDLSRRDLDRDLDLDIQKISVSTVEKISTVFKS